MFHQTSVSTSESYCVQVPMATSDHDCVVPQESDLSKLELAQAELKRLEEENASLREAKFGLERFYSDDNSDAETGGRFRKSENTVLKVRCFLNSSTSMKTRRPGITVIAFTTKDLMGFSSIEDEDEALSILFVVGSATGEVDRHH
eukprot:XP_019918861.1 PREDICTED: uncharacterized protein LOC109617387 [Crassostrea gigas]